MAQYPRTGSVRVVENGESVREGDDHVVRLQHEISVTASLLEEYCFAMPQDVGYDLMTIVGAVKYADRAFTRHHGQGWSRSLKVQVPVFDKALWQRADVTEALEGCLTFLTGDKWKFACTQRRKKPPSHGHLAGLTHGTSHAFIPYSHGLDSYAQLKLLEEREENTTPVCVFTSNTGRDKTWKALCRDKPRGDVKPIPIPIIVPKIPHPEPTFRTRPFLYYSMAAYGAILAGSHRVIIPENAQGSLGGSLITMGYECKHRSCHPAFTQKLRVFLEKVTGARVQFEHPELFRTKAEVLADLARRRDDTDEWLLEHWSCSHDQRHSSFDHKHVHCGVCGNCLLRRMSVDAIHINDPTEYLFSDLSKTTIEESAVKTVKAIQSFMDIAGNGIRSMQRLADLADTPERATIWAEVAAIAKAMDGTAGDIHSQLMRMLNRHKSEWSTFVEKCGRDSWVSRIAKE